MAPTSTIRSRRRRAPTTSPAGRGGSGREGRAARIDDAPPARISRARTTEHASNDEGKPRQRRVGLLADGESGAGVPGSSHQRGPSDGALHRTAPAEAGSRIEPDARAFATSRPRGRCAAGGPARRRLAPASLGDRRAAPCASTRTPGWPAATRRSSGAASSHNGRYRIMWDGTTQKLADVQANSNGFFEVEVTIPGGADAGRPHHPCLSVHRLPARQAGRRGVRGRRSGDPETDAQAHTASNAPADTDARRHAQADPQADGSTGRHSDPAPGRDESARSGLPGCRRHAGPDATPHRRRHTRADSSERGGRVDRPVPRPRRHRRRGHPGHPEPRQLDAAGDGSADLRPCPHRRHRCPASSPTPTGSWRLGVAAT